MNPVNYKIFWLRSEIEKLKKDRESLVKRIENIDKKLQLKEYRLKKLNDS